MNNEMPDEIWAGFGWDQKVLSAGAWYSEPLKDHQHRYTKTDLTDRRTDVDALIKVAVDVAESLTQLTGMNVDDLYEAVDAVTEKRK